MMAQAVQRSLKKLRVKGLIFIQKHYNFFYLMFFRSKFDNITTKQRHVLSFSGLPVINPQRVREEMQMAVLPICRKHVCFLSESSNKNKIKFCTEQTHFIRHKNAAYAGE